MPNVHRSQEVYKRIKGLRGDAQPLRALRGLYVSGTHLEPQYIDNNISITDFGTSVELKVVNYTQKDQTMPDDHILSFLNIETNQPKITSYTTTSKSLPDDHILQFLNVETNQPRIVSYETKKESLPDDHILQFLNVETNQPRIVAHKRSTYNMTPEPCIRLMSFTVSEDIVVTNST